MKIKTANLTGPALDWAVAMATGIRVILNFPGVAYIPEGKRSYYKWVPSTNWKQGGPIIERERIAVNPHEEDVDCWYALPQNPRAYCVEGPTALVAAMRCFVASKLGDEVDVPDELCV